MVEDMQTSLLLFFVHGDVCFDSTDKFSFSSFNKLAHMDLIVNICSKRKRTMVTNKPVLKNSLSK